MSFDRSEGSLSDSSRNGGCLEGFSSPRSSASLPLRLVRDRVKAPRMAQRTQTGRAKMASTKRRPFSRKGACATAPDSHPCYNTYARSEDPDPQRFLRCQKMADAMLPTAPATIDAAIRQDNEEEGLHFKWFQTKRHIYDRDIDLVCPVDEPASSNGESLYGCLPRNMWYHEVHRRPCAIPAGRFGGARRQRHTLSLKTLPPRGSPLRGRVPLPRRHRTAPPLVAGSGRQRTAPAAHREVMQPEDRAGAPLGRREGCAAGRRWHASRRDFFLLL
jgi:hypothetical protein